MNCSNKIASFDVDAQKSFTPLCLDKPPVSGGDTINAALSQLASHTALHLGSRDAHSPKAAQVVESVEQMLRPLAYSDVDPTWMSHCVSDTPGFRLLDKLPRPINCDLLAWKDVEPDLYLYGACYHNLTECHNTRVIEYPRQNDASHALMGGLVLDYCVKNTILQLHHANFEILLYLPARRAIAEDTAQRICDETRDTGVILYADLE